MSKQNITPLHIEIKTIMLDNKKMTKSILNQIEEFECFDKNMDFVGDEIFGYVKDKDKRYLLWKRNEKLRKSSLLKYYSLRKLDRLPDFDSTEWFLKKIGIDYEAYDGDGLRFSERFSEHEQYDELIEKVNSFLKVINNSQLFI